MGVTSPPGTIILPLRCDRHFGFARAAAGAAETIAETLRCAVKLVSLRGVLNGDQHGDDEDDRRRAGALSVARSFFCRPVLTRCWARSRGRLEYQARRRAVTGKPFEMSPGCRGSNQAAGGIGPCGGVPPDGWPQWRLRRRCRDIEEH